MSQVLMPPSSDAGEPEESGTTSRLTVARADALPELREGVGEGSQAEAAAQAPTGIPAEPVAAAQSGTLPSQPPNGATMASPAGAARSVEGMQPAETAAYDGPMAQSGAWLGPPQWVPPTQPNHSRPYGSQPQYGAPMTGQPASVQVSPSAQWRQQAPAQVQWPQQYPQPQMPQQPPQPQYQQHQYPYAQPQAPYSQPSPQSLPDQRYAGSPQTGGAWQQPMPQSMPQPMQQPVPVPSYPGYPQVYPQPGQPVSWPHALPGYAQPGTMAPAVVPPGRGVVESGGTGAWQGYEKPKQAFIWKVIKWPIKTLLKGVYVTGSAARRHRAVAIVLLLVIALLAGGGYAVYQATHPEPAATASNQASSAGQQDITPFTIVTAAQPPLSPGVITFLHGYKTFDGFQLWNSLSPALQQNLQANGVSPSQLNSDLQQEKHAGIAYAEFIYTGGFLSPDGTAHYTVEVVETLGNARAVRTWFFMTNTNDKVINFQDLSPQAGQGG